MADRLRDAARLEVLDLGSAVAEFAQNGGGAGAEGQRRVDARPILRELDRGAIAPDAAQARDFDFQRDPVLQDVRVAEHELLVGRGVGADRRHAGREQRRLPIRGGAGCQPLANQLRERVVVLPARR